MAASTADIGDRNVLYYGDNLEVLRTNVAPKSVDLAYLDPPSFPQGFSYEVGAWSDESENHYRSIVERVDGSPVSQTILAMVELLGRGNLSHYLVSMAARLVEVHRTLKVTGWLFLHCDVDTSHYMKTILDSIFGRSNFRDQIIWQRNSSSYSATPSLSRGYDTILVYAKSPDASWNPDGIFRPHSIEETKRMGYRPDEDGRLYRLDSLRSPFADRPSLTYEFLGVTSVWRWSRERMQELYESGLIVESSRGGHPRLKRYLDERPGKPLTDLWTDIQTLTVRSSEYTGFRTQKPLELLSRIVGAASRVGDTVLDPYVGSGTAIESAHRLGRRWIGIESSMHALEIVYARLQAALGEQVDASYDFIGTPTNIDDARKLFELAPHEFERWCLMLLGGQPPDERTGDRKVDGIVRLSGASEFGSHRAVISVKAPRVNERNVTELLDSIKFFQADMGVIVSLHESPPAAIEAARLAGTFTYPANGKDYPVIQIITVDKLLREKHPVLPDTLIPFFQIKRFSSVDDPNRTLPPSSV